MIPTIGLMLAAYIVTRMVEVSFTCPSKLVRVLAALTVIWTLFCALSLLMGSIETTLPGVR